MSQEFLDHTIALLERTPAAADALLRGLPDIWTARNEGGETWTVREILGHLIHGERTDWMARVRMILQHGDAQTFEPFDRVGYRREIEGRALDDLLTEFARVRSRNVADLRALDLQPQDLERCGRHPAFGLVTLAHLVATWAAHDLTHLHQISRVMAYQYRDAVGPWVAYLGVLHCHGHSE